MLNTRGIVELKVAWRVYYLTSIIEREINPEHCSHTCGPFHKSSYERFLLYDFVEPVLKYRSNEFVALTNLWETGPWIPPHDCSKIKNN